MVAARALGISFSVTLHGSDLLVQHAYLDTKLEHCRFCVTISEFNRSHILKHYPAVAASKIVVGRMGVDIPQSNIPAADRDQAKFPLLLTVGRLHPVKDHVFLVKACAELRRTGLRTLCLIAGEGAERRSLERLIRKLALTEEVGLLGQVPHEQLDAHYAMADLVVLTSRSEGIPVVLMEAMAMGNIVLAPEITGIPELVIHGKTGFLYKPGSLEDFVAKVQMIWELRPGLDAIRRAARKQVQQNFNRDKNLAEFAAMFLDRIAATREACAHEDSILQQI
jgi:glycosyltransferase involved in cell wall biosynthesis